MLRRKYKTDPGVLLAQGQEIVATTKDARFQHKVEMVNLVLGGIPPSELSRYCAESKNTITLWVKTADEKGFGALVDGAAPRAPAPAVGGAAGGDRGGRPRGRAAETRVPGLGRPRALGLHKGALFRVPLRPPVPADTPRPRVLPREAADVPEQGWRRRRGGAGCL